MPKQVEVANSTSRSFLAVLFPRDIASSLQAAFSCNLKAQRVASANSLGLGNWGVAIVRCISIWLCCPSERSACNEMQTTLHLAHDTAG